MTETEIISLIRLVSLPIYAVLIVAILLRQIDRVMRFRLFGERVPAVLRRDLVLFGALFVLIGGPLVAGIFGVTLGDKLWWVVFSTLVGLAALGVWAYFSYFVIGKEAPVMEDKDELEKRSNESGQGLAEYALILALVAVMAIAVLALFGDAIVQTFQNLLGQLPGNGPAPTP